MLEVKNLESGYDHLQVLWKVSLEVHKGELIGLLGRNGAGKTTTLRSIAGLVKPKRGSIHFLQHRIDNRLAHEVSRLKISFIPETLNLFSRMSVAENIALGAYNIRDPKKTQERLEYVYTLFPVLADRRRQLAGTLSGGERRMLAIARGLMSQPELMLVDEPSLGLAPKAAVAVFEALCALRKEGLTVLLVEQNVHTTLQISDRSYVLEQGRVVLEGESKELLGNEHVCKTYLGSGE